MFVFLIPLLWILGISFKTRIQTFSMPPLLIWKPTLENYITVLTRGEFLRAFVNSLLDLDCGGGRLSLVVGVPAAYAFARCPFRGRSFLFFSLLVMRMLPPIAILRADVCLVQQSRPGQHAHRPWSSPTRLSACR